MALDNFVAGRDLKLLDTLAADLGLNLQSEPRRKLAQYLELVVHWNQRMDLTAARGPHQQLEVLVADALVLADVAMIATSARLVDVGTGAGAPVIPLLIVRPDLNAVLVESKQKRVAFLNTAVGMLDLGARARVRLQRLDPGRPRVEGQPFDLAISRATFAPEVWLKAALALAPRAAVFTASAEAPAATAESEIALVRDYPLPFSGAPRRITIYQSGRRSDATGDPSAAGV
jgi:16S rRNA (guanine527-N7)-methyltransferase